MKNIIFIAFFIISIGKLQAYEKTKNSYSLKKEDVFGMSDILFNSVREANDYFNSFKYVKDEDLWNKKDYWSTPEEFRNMGAGDCEDFAVAKYFYLKDLGFSEKNLLLSYAYIKKTKEPHMVLIYKDKETEYVLDNINKELKLKKDRNDLNFVYYFNENDLYLNKNNNYIKVNSSEIIKPWKILKSKVLMNS